MHRKQHEGRINGLNAAEKEEETKHDPCCLIVNEKFHHLPLMISFTDSGHI